MTLFKYLSAATFAAVLVSGLSTTQAATTATKAAPVAYVETVEESNDVVPVAVAPKPAPVAVAAPRAPIAAAASRPQAAPAASSVVAASRTVATGRSVIALSTAYNSLENQTDSTPHITATGTRTRPGVVAMSRDMLRIFPYGTRVKIEDLSGRYDFSGRVFVVEDTMHPRKTNQVDVWMPSYAQALQWGRRQVRITALR